MFVRGAKIIKKREMSAMRDATVPWHAFLQGDKEEHEQKIMQPGHAFRFATSFHFFPWKTATLILMTSCISRKSFAIGSLGELLLLHSWQFLWWQIPARECRHGMAWNGHTWET